LEIWLFSGLTEPTGPQTFSALLRKGRRQAGFSLQGLLWRAYGDNNIRPQLSNLSPAADLPSTPGGGKLFFQLVNARDEKVP